MQIEIRKATPEDLPAILAIVNFSILHSTAIYDYEIRTIEEQKQWFKDKLNAQYPVIVATINNVITGFGSYDAFRYKAAYQFTVEHSVYVAEEYKAKGIGKLLLKNLIEIATINGFHTIIGCIDAENKGSIAFHEKFGFINIGTIKQVGYKFDRWLDLVIMQLFLK